MAKSLSFEEALKKMDDIITKMDSDSISLEESVSLYTEGIKLADICDKELSKTKQKVSMIEDEINKKTAVQGEEM